MQALKFGPSYTTTDVGWDAQRTVNLIPEIDETGEAKAGMNLRLVTAPGTVIRALSTNLSLRGMCKLPTGLVIVVAQNTDLQRTQIFTFDEELHTLTPVYHTDDYVNGPPDLIGPNKDGWFVPNVYFERYLIRFAYNGADLIIVDGDNDMVRVNLRDYNAPGFLWDFMRALGGVPYFTPTDVTFAGGYFVFSEVGDFNYNSVRSAKFYISGLYDTTIDLLDVATAEYKGDGLIAVGSMSNALWLFGARSTEVWANTGNVDFPFERINGASSDVGIISRASLQQLADAFIWLACTSGGRPFIAMTQGYTPSRISTQAIDAKFASLDATWFETATSFTYSHAGHYFYGINVGVLGTTFVYDLSTKMWHERTIRHYSTNLPTSVGYCHSTAGMGCEKFVFRPGEPGIFELDFVDSTLQRTVVQQTGVEMDCERSFPIVAHPSGNRIQHDKVQLDASAGSASQQPAYTLQWSDTSGRDFRPGRTLQPADVGEYTERFIWRRLGVSRSRLYKLNFSTGQHISLRSMMLDDQVLGS